MNQNILETIIGFIIIVVATVFAIFAYSTSGNTEDEIGYVLEARFQNAEGIFVGADVMLAGIKIGSVLDLTLDRDTFFAIMKIGVKKDVKLPQDSQVAIVSSGFLGGKFVSVSPGGDVVDLKDGDQVKFTQSSVNMEALIGKFMYSYGNNNSQGSK
jgi:phospholipid/cholesterol/gamma-HCH transport system substrate-binding protein